LIGITSVGPAIPSLSFDSERCMTLTDNIFEESDLFDCNYLFHETEYIFTSKNLAKTNKFSLNEDMISKAVFSSWEKDLIALPLI
jgi:hypothetical protein